MLLFAVATLLLHLKGLSCFIIIGAGFFGAATVGAQLYLRLTARLKPRRDKTLVVAAFALLPYLAVLVENQVATPDSSRRVENTIDSAAPAPVVGQHLIRVAPIGAAELAPGPFDAIGFPRPVEATLTRAGVGGVRHATFRARRRIR